MSTEITTGIVVAVIGLATVFVVLAILWGVLEIMRVIFGQASNKLEAPKIAPAPAPVPQAPSTEEDDIIAVLTAAVAAMLDKPASGLQIKSYRRVDSSTPVWNKIARQDNLVR